MKGLRILLIVLCVAVIADCSYITMRRTERAKNYTLNVDERSSVDTPMIVSEQISLARGAIQHGLQEEQDPWQSVEYPTKDALRKELVYRGLSDHVIHLEYREYHAVLTNPSFSQELFYDLRNSDIILYKSYRIQVLHASPEYIRFRVLSD